MTSRSLLAAIVRESYGAQEMWARPDRRILAFKVDFKTGSNVHVALHVYNWTAHIFDGTLNTSYSTTWRTSMSLQTHLVELEKKHKALENALASALAHPSASDVELAEMKRKKLHLKDEITRVKASLSTAKVTLH